jgi:hypothetical protein
MSRPALTHDGFLIPNAGDVTNPRMAEPDRIDFNTIASARWGVVEGCLVTVSGLTALIGPGLAIVNGTLVTVLGQSLSIPSGGAQDRFDLVVVNEAGVASSIIGTYSTDPVFPDPPIGVTLLAAIFAPSSVSNLSDNVIDKRKLLSKSLLTKIPTGDMLLQNKNDTGNHFTLTGGGTLGWEGDTGLWRSAPFTLRVNKRLTVDETVQAGGAITTDSDVTALGRVKGRNLQTGNTASRPATGTTGEIYQDETSGKLYVWRNGAWKELATLDSAQPTGCVMTSVEPPSVMIPLGWLPLDGRTITEAEYPSMFTLTSMAGYITGTSPNRVMTLPNAEGRVMLTRWGGAGTVSGPANNRIALNLTNMPRHRHNTAIAYGGGGSLRGTVGRAGTHAHSVGGGEHWHTVNDPGHKHNGMESPIGTNSDVVGLFWGGRNKIDAYFNDRNHTFSVEAYQWTMPAYVGITINSAGSDHGHILGQDGDHDHPLYLNDLPQHIHNTTEQDQGDSTPFDITPAHLTVYTYIRS